MSAKWKDETSYSQGDKERVPRIWTIRLGAFRLTVHRFHGDDPTKWFASCQIFEKRELAAKEVKQAQDEALDVLNAELERAINASCDFLDARDRS